MKRVGIGCIFFAMSAVQGAQLPQDHGHVWRKVQARAKDTVVQIFVQKGIFNWLEPYKTPNFKQQYGSGFFIDAQGHIVSNFHVIDQAHGLKIQIPSLGKEQFDIEIVGVCPERDLCLLKLTQEAFARVQTKLGKIPFLEMGDSDKVVRTQEVLALGYPLRQEKLKSTQGIVSGREIVRSESYIQITAALNPGNSGGPSLDCQGCVIGINTARVSSAQNVSYIMPINDAKSVINDLRKITLLRLPILGWEFNYGNKEMVNFFKNPTPGGLYIARIYPHTPLALAGIQAGDMVYSINGQKLDLYGETHADWSEDKLPTVALLNRFQIGQSLHLEFYRNGIRKETSCIFQHLKDLPIRRYYPGHEKIDYEIIGGLVVMPLTVNHLEKLVDRASMKAKHLAKYEERENQYESKLLVTHIFPTSQAQEARCIKVGDILSEINGKPVSTLDQLREIIKNSYDKVGKERFITFRTDDKKFMVLSLEKVLHDEERLSLRYSYHKTHLMVDLLVRSGVWVHEKKI